MELTKEIKIELSRKYYQDFKRMKKGKVKNEKAAVGRERTLREAVVSARKKRKPLATEPKRMAAALMSYYGHLNNEGKRKQMQIGRAHV